MNTSNHRLQGVADLSALLYSHGVKRVVICPGSRNVPIINSLVSFDKLECISIVDERSAAYFAMGVAQQSNEPVAITCTSGTAAANMLPAITEAYYLEIPIVVITADRPIEWINQSDSQAINQISLFKTHVLHEVNLPVETYSYDDLWCFRRSVSECLGKAVGLKYGPVHINIPLREPLYEVLPHADEELRHIVIKRSIPDISAGLKEQLKNKWKQLPKKMIIVGVDGNHESLNILMNKHSNQEDTVVIAENISNVCGNKIIESPESFFASIGENEEEIFSPDLVVSVGGTIVSKRLKQFLRENKASEHWSINNTGDVVDTFQMLNQVIVADPALLLEEMPLNNQGSGFAKLYGDRKRLVENYKDEIFTDAQFSDFKVVGSIINKIHSGINMHLGNSSAVRLAQLFSTKKEVCYYSNRGASGIDGCVSTAIGAASVSGKTDLLICGDLTFLYDSNGLWNSNLPNNIKIVVLNNLGGNIFNLIKTGKAFEKVQPFLITPQKVNIEKIVTAYGVSYFNANNISEFDMIWDEFINNETASVLEVKTDMEINTQVFSDVFQNLKGIFKI